MKRESLIQQFTLIFFVVGLLGFHSCDNLNEDLPECRLYVTFKYDYNVLSVDAFHKQVDKVELYVFDKDGKFLFSQVEEGAALSTGSYRMEVPLPVGEYKFMAWAGAHDSYEITSFTRGATTIEEMKLRLKRDQSLIIDKELEPLWYGEILNVNFNGKTNQTEIINLIKDTNKVRFIFQGETPEWTVNVDDYTYEIIESNGYMDYDNSLLDDDILSYRPYYSNQVEPAMAVVEMNTMRLMEDRPTRLIVTHKATGKQVFNINMTQYLVLIKVEGHNWGPQEYLDREDEYAIAFFFSNTSPSDQWLAVKLRINSWTWYIQHTEE